MNGILNILKPPGMTSHDVVSYVRKKSGFKKVGHTGTLDPGAAGILPVCIGKSTKIVDFIMNDKKEYICELKLGNKTDTYDKYGESLYLQDRALDKLDFETFKKTSDTFVGNIKQTPPAYSAIKINGKRAYELARKGESFDVPERNITVFSLDILKFSLPYVMLKIKCSKGTYIRSICNDIGEMLGCGAYMNFLLRTSTGKFNLNNCCYLDDIDKESISSLLFKTEFALDMEEIYVDSSLSKKVLNGNSIYLGGNYDIKNEGKLVKVFLHPNDFVGIGRIENNVLFIEKLLV